MTSTATGYETDVIAWANEQARLLRAGLFSQLDIEHIADEIEDVGKSEQRELASRMAVLLTHLLKWQFQSAYRGKSWQTTIRHQRRAIHLHLKHVPSLKAKLNDAEWWEVVWGDAVSQAMRETGLELFPEICPWTFEQIMDPEFWPSNPDYPL
jgi:hypothetical protein